MPAWEYKSITRQVAEMLTDEQLNLLGQHNFELVNVLSVDERHTVVGRQEIHTVVHYFFKRPRTAAPAVGASVPAARPAAPPTATA